MGLAPCRTTVYPMTQSQTPLPMPPSSATFISAKGRWKILKPGVGGVVGFTAVELAPNRPFLSHLVHRPPTPKETSKSPKCSQSLSPLLGFSPSGDLAMQPSTLMGCVGEFRMAVTKNGAVGSGGRAQGRRTKRNSDRGRTKQARAPSRAPWLNMRLQIFSMIKADQSCKALFESHIMLRHQRCY